jgi:hypothetical protein
VLDPAQFPQHHLAPLRCSTEVNGPCSESGHNIIEPTAHGLLAFQHIHRANYHFKFVKLKRNSPNRVAHFQQPLLVQTVAFSTGSRRETPGSLLRGAGKGPFRRTC